MPEGGDRWFRCLCDGRLSLLGLRKTKHHDVAGLDVQKFGLVNPAQAGRQHRMNPCTRELWF